MLTWVPMQPVADALADLDGVSVEVLTPDVSRLPASAAEVEFYVPPFFPAPQALTAMARMPKLKVVQTLTAGFDRVRPHVPAGAVLCNARGVHDASTAEWVMTAVLASIRQFPYFGAEQAAGRWAYRFTGCLAGQTVLIIGYGSIGKAVEARLAGFDVQVRRVARTARPGVSPVAELATELPLADVVILLAPLTSETTGMADAAFLRLLKDGALLVNAARGPLVVTEELVAELRTGRISAALDVTDPEPLPPGHPLWAMANVLITPHVAASTPASGLAAASFVHAQVGRYITAEPLLNVITGDY